MAMELSRVRAVLAFYRKQLHARGGLEGPQEPTRMTALRVSPRAAEHGLPQAHILSMIDAVDELILEGRREKVMRWYGFIQGALWALGVFTVDELKSHSNPDKDPPT